MFSVWLCVIFVVLICDVMEHGLNSDYLYYMRIFDLGIMNHFVTEAYFQVHYWSHK